MLAEVVSACRPDGQVRLRGELWAATCDAGADPGASVRVRSVDGLRLRVEPTQV
jgi:membrane protein implicated in regulation of membrane protease activity